MSGKRIKWNQEIFIDYCADVHNGKYSYGNVKYKNMSSYISITCPEHGDFTQNAQKHKIGRGCPECAKETRVAHRRMSFVEFVRRSRETHGDTYEYIEGTYKGYNKPVGVVCPDHGTFWPTAYNHIKGKICRDCHLENRTFSFASCAEEFEHKSVKVHGNKYLYDFVEYTNNKTPVALWCKHHKECFEQRPDNHLMGKEGCPHCLASRNTGWIADIYRTEEESSLYLIALSNKNTDEEFLKIGLSVQPKERWRQLERSSPYTCEVLEVFTGPAKGLLRCETNVLVDNRGHKHTPETDFHGRTECFKIEGKEAVQKSIRQHLPRSPT